MDCSLSSLIEASKCYRCIPKPVMQASAISLLCQWANNLTPVIHWTPESHTAFVNGTGPFTLPQVQAMDPTTIIALSFDQQGTLQTLTGLSSLTNLQDLFCDQENMSGTLDLSGNPNLVNIYCHDNNLTGLILPAALPNLVLFYVENNQISGTINFSGNANLTDFSAGNNKYTAINLSGCVNLDILLCYSNLLGTLDITGDTVITTYYFNNNPSFNQVGP